MAPLLEWSRGMPAGGPRLMRLLCRCLFNGSLYTNRHRIARGAFAQVGPTLTTLSYPSPAVYPASCNYDTVFL